MRVLHAAALLSPPSGIVSQMEWEQLAASQLGIPWHVKMFCPKDSCAESSIICRARWLGSKRKSFFWKLYAWLILRIEYHIWLYSLVRDYDVFVLRYYVHDPFQLLFILLCKRPVYLVHHTLEVPELAMPGSAGARLRSWLEAWIGKYAVRYSRGTIGVTQEILKHQDLRGHKERESYLYPNGVFYEKCTVPDERCDISELLFVAGFFAPWHGLDLLLNDIESSDREFILHLVGTLSEADQARAAKDKRIVLHGYQVVEGVRKISERCSVGLSSFALSRKGMTEACTLKVREYLMAGLPVYAGYQEVLPSSFAYYRSGPPSIVDILDFASSVRSVSREQVVVAARPHIDKSVTLDALYRAMKNARGFEG